MRTRVFVLAALVVAVILAGGVSYWASDSPDGLNRVAIDHGFDASQTQHGTSESPLAGYGTAGVDDPLLSGAVAGVVGVAVTFALAGAITFTVRRRRATSRTTSSQAGGPSGER